MHMRTVYFLAAVATLPLFGCGGAGQVDPTGAAPVGPNQPPSGCRTTVCDLMAASCVNPPTHCESCRNTCITLGPMYFEECENACDMICALPPDERPCATNLKLCRSTAKNGVCADRLAEPAPGGAPCNLDMIKANCACGPEHECYQALDKVNPACKACNDGWVLKCANAVCTVEGQSLDSCQSANHCSDVPGCSLCLTELKNWQTCFNAAQNDPRDIGGCYSGSHACWADPICPN